MSSKVDKKLTRQAHQLPPEFYSSQVDALFSEAGTLVLGATAACAAVLVVAVTTSSWLIASIGGLLALLSTGRFWMLKRYVRLPAQVKTPCELRRWETFYDIGAAMHVGLLGAFCLLTFWTTTDDFARLMSFATILSYMVGIPGRNFASAAGVNIQVLCGALPLLSAMAVGGARYWILNTLVLLPLFLALRGIASRLRAIFVQAITKASDFSLVASRFDTALNNMPHGLAMVDSLGTVVVTNAKLIELLLLDGGKDYVGSPFATLLGGADLDDDLDRRLWDFQTQLANPPTEVISLEMRNGVSLEFAFQPMSNGGAVIVVQDVSERKRQEARINQLALFDDLTKLGNRSHFRSYMEAVLNPTSEQPQRFALMFIDLDQFKQVNDSLGHPSGDLLLRDVADRLRNLTDPGDTIARFGGDEFVVLHAIGGGRRSAEQLATDLIAELSKPYDLNGHSVVVGASIGIALIPEHGADPDQLFKEADMALYSAKAAGRGLFRIFEAQMDVQARKRMELEFDLHQALKNGEFEVHYQPIYSFKKRGFSVCEALVRWRHPRRGLVSPAEFIPVAEEMGLIVPIGDWVLRQACLECATWPADVNVAVNISSVQFRSGDLLPSVCAALAGAELAPERLELELTESVLLNDVNVTTVVMEQLHQLRVRISLDDFGTGYSSLSYLHTLPLNKVKIDRSFLAGLGTSEKTLLMLRGVARLSTELGLTVVVEGIETDDQLAMISHDTHVDEVQGYLFSRPLPSRELQALLQRKDNVRSRTQAAQAA